MREPSSKTGDPVIGRRIAEHRAAWGMSRTDLAEQSGLSYSYIAQIETGYRMPAYKQQMIIAKVLHASLDELFGEEEQDAAESPDAERMAYQIGSTDPQPSARAPRRSLEEVLEDASTALESLPASVRLDALSRLQLRIMRGIAAETQQSAGPPSQGWIERLAENEVFVFGSNPEGRHAGGAARTAFERFGAEWGEPRGLHGQSYGIVTMSGLGVIMKEVATFLGFARSHPELRFLLTPIGTGVAGHRADEIAPLFESAPDNVVLPAEFVVQ